MIAFILTMPRVNTWNGKWSGEDRLFARVKPNRGIPKEVVGKDFYYSWSDGWCACVSTKSITSSDANKIRRKSSGFCGYDWMISSIIEYGEILTEREIKELEGA